ncbi:MAG: isoprenylcysteine carboxylmethyltransferase family protein [Acidimicrobiia bacterium]
MALHRSGSRSATIRAYALVAGQFTLLAVLLLWHPSAQWTIPGSLRTVAAGAGIAGAVWLCGGLLSFGRSLSAVPLPVEHGTLKTGGLFRFSRHPIYTGLLAIAWSSSVRSGALAPLLVAALLTALLSVKARFEEAALATAYPGYGEYALRTPRFVPWPQRLRRSSRSSGLP